MQARVLASAVRGQGERVVDSSEQVAQAAVKMGAAADVAKSTIELNTLLSVVLICVALLRNIYDRWIRKETKEAKTQVRYFGLAVDDIYKAFDAVALVCVIPLFAKDGVKSAIGVWGLLKRCLAMTKDALTSVEMFQRLFASKEEKEHPFLGSGLIQEVVGAAEDLAGRVGPGAPVAFVSGGTQSGSVSVESDSDDDDDDAVRAPNAKMEQSCRDEAKEPERKQNGAPPCCRDIDGPCFHEINERKQAAVYEVPEPESWWCYHCNALHTDSYQCPYMVDNERKQAGPVVEPRASSHSPFECECVGCAETHKLDGIIYCGACLKERKVGIPVAYPVSDGRAHAAAEARAEMPADAMHAGLRKIWDTQEALLQLNKLRALAEKKTWIVPLVCVLLFGGLLVIGRCMRSNPVAAKSGKERKREAKEAARLEKNTNLKKAFTEHLESELRKVKGEKPEAWILPKWMQYEEVPGMGGCCHDPKMCPLKEGRPVINSMQKCDVECGGSTCVHWAGCKAHSVAPKNLAPVEKPEAGKPKSEKPTTTPPIDESKEDRKKKSKGFNPRPTGKGSNKNFTKRLRKPWIDYDDEGGVLSVTYEDEMGNLVTRAGRRAAKSAMDAYYAKYGGAGLTEKQEAQFAELQKRPFTSVKEEELAEDAVVLKMPKGVVFEKLEGKFVQPICNGKVDCKCGRVFHSVKKANAKGLKAAKKAAVDKQHAAWKKDQKCYKCHALGHVATDCENVVCQCGKKDHTDDKPVKFVKPAKPAEFKPPAEKAADKLEKQEASVNGARFDTHKVLRSLGWAQTDKGKGCCFCATLNGLYVPEHLLKKDATVLEDATTVTVFHPAYPAGVTMSAAKATNIGRDSMILPRPSAWTHEMVPSLGATSAQVAAKVKLIAFDSLDDCLKGRFRDDSGLIKTVTANPGQERAVYVVSSADGNCGAPVVTTDGLVCGFHNSTSVSYTTFVPVTKLMVAKATGSVQSFC
jgi:hypothetical protein